LGASELAAGLLRGVPSLVESVADVAIDSVPPGVKDWAIATFGTWNKVALVIGIVLTLAVLGAGIGVLARRSLLLAGAALVLLGMVGVAAAVLAGRPGGGAVAGATAAVLAGLIALRWLLGRGRAPDNAPDAGPDAGRRAFLVAAGVVAGLAALSAAAGRTLVEQGKRVLAGRDGVVLPTASQPLPPPAPEASFPESGISPLVTPNEDFFRIDTALSVPRVDLESWRLRIHGMVETPYELSFEDLLGMDMVERWVTLSCVSNTLGGNLVGNAAWLGVPLGVLLDRAGVRPGADQVVGRSVDGFTVGVPTSAARDGRDALVAIGMNGEPLPFEHGFPARLVVAGLYGYVSATKWLSEIELTTWDAFDAYWVPRGWSKEAPVKTQSRIDTPRTGTRLSAGERAIAGVAWAPHVGITRVEVQLDEDPWQEAELAESLDRNSWRQWRLVWNPEPGVHVIRVRATDASGYTQTDERTPPAPDGATGHHIVRVTVEA
ncbi:MAG: molybdopterin-dependent oxidoreductase, partial [Actinomycetes bacterium]|nr:molybdopterin-dependent oxidoreductase [Actinomycetes bacterium]MDX5380895.1 molybdopterin-dependent oxidoreductase [Actinomycetes bacterium]MDX5399985.1 molybdopterin-dependent oxidoreductase [Actinomycetes bacterium]MDX5450646.1 molybdopterin-dependent oxidoreductase [Actinomycetes bacterium]